MARRHRRSSGNTGGLITLIIVVCIIAIIVKFWIPLLIIGGVILLIYIITRVVKASKARSDTYQNAGNNKTAERRVGANAQADEKKQSDEIASVDESKVAVEVDRQIKRSIYNKERLRAERVKTLRQIKKYSHFWNKNKTTNIEKVKELEERLSKLDTSISCANYVFREQDSDIFVELQDSLHAMLGLVTTTVHDDSPLPSELICENVELKDLEYISFTQNPFFLKIYGNYYCITPNYILQFDKDGNYITTYPAEVMLESIVPGTFTRQVEHHTWEHTRTDGGPDLRYRDNSRITYYTNESYSVSDMVVIKMPGISIRYEVSNTQARTRVSRAIEKYVATTARTTLDPGYCLVRLLEWCLPDNKWLSYAEDVIQGKNPIPDIDEDETLYEEYEKKRWHSSLDKSNSASPRAPDSSNSNILKKILKIALIIIACIAVLCCIIVILALNDSTKTESEIETVTEAEVQTEVVTEAVTELIEESTAEVVSEYIFENSDTRLLNDADVEGMTKEDIQMAINEIYARKGRRFGGKNGEYFESKSWYDPKYSKEEFDKMNVFSDTEWANIKFLSDQYKKR